MSLQHGSTSVTDVVAIIEGSNGARRETFKKLGVTRMRVTAIGQNRRGEQEAGYESEVEAHSRCESMDGERKDKCLKLMQKGQWNLTLLCVRFSY